MKTLHIFGVTGSIGQSAADIVLAHPDRFSVHTVTAHKNVMKLAEAAKQLKAQYAVIADEALYDDLKAALSGSGIACASGAAAVTEAARVPADISLMAIVGIAGLKPLWAALEHSKAVAIANKEPLVAAGPMVMARAAEFGTAILPVDSEHNAIFQVFDQNNKAAVERIILTASGGPFREWSLDQMADATPEQALRHPTWSMGAKISIDSATMMNKALEIIEAHYLFDMPPSMIEVMVHPQSLVHGMVEYADGSFLCQMGASDMRTPIISALSWPERIATPGRKLDLETLTILSFERPDFERFPALRLAYDCLNKGLAACIALNAGNEVMVDEFLSGRCGFLDIAGKTSRIIDGSNYDTPQTLDDVIAIDQDVRARIKCAIVETDSPKVSKNS
ncbi:MAG: 1-deoxy-D-xylulose-5-phosphate reductoisomerase [Alphaproteobacteria bacterium]|nr:1-deoxy-D-xylulose-5-phosphate reductoisomerase [Alphaproteobacteria bacterium]MCD8520401.1 1-deoxy-D-xylulose-5-phosphate reductoisomerase [Alphaproteobacteria bacterium]MCD8570088.1 1-deoxy-D-xylulose-5-phosphate reductoisomerase [Alphaproteobacteria bacterium]